MDGKMVEKMCRGIGDDDDNDDNGGGGSGGDDNIDENDDDYGNSSTMVTTCTMCACTSVQYLLTEYTYAYTQCTQFSTRLYRIWRC